MVFLFGLLGLITGAVVDGGSGALFGTGIGILAGVLIGQRARIEALERQLRDQPGGVRVPGAASTPVPPPAVTSLAVGPASAPPPESGLPAVPTPAATAATPTAAVGTPHATTAQAGTAPPAAATRQAAPPPPRRPNPVTTFIRRFFTTGNVVVKVGAIVLFFGVAFLLKYAAERQLLPVEVRLAAVAAGGVFMLITGWRLRHRREKYALVLQGAAVAVLYLTVFAAGRLYGVVPMGATFAVLLALVLGSSVLAVLQNSRSLAVFATAGGFLAPILTSTGQGSHVALFTYYALLNAGILAIAWYRAWRILNWVGFVFTFVIGALWGIRYYQPEHFNTTEPFLVLFFLFYLAIPVLFAHRQPPRLKGLVDGTLVFGVPLTAFTLQAGLVHDFEFGMALSALGVAAIYLMLATTLWNRQVEGMRLLVEAFLALAVIFASLAIPFALDGRWTAAAWAVEGAGMTWVGIRQGRLLPRIFGLLLHVGGGLAFAASVGTPVDRWPVLNSAAVGSLLISFGGLFSGWQIWRHREQLRDWERPWHVLLLVWGLLWWFGGGLNEISDHVPRGHRLDVLVAFVAASMALVQVAGRRLDWPAARQAPVLLLPFIMLAALAGFASPRYGHPFEDAGALSWILAFAVSLWLLRREEDAWDEKLRRAWHAISLWLALFVVAWGTDGLLEMHTPLNTWSELLWGLIPAAGAGALMTFADRVAWPLRRYRDTYLGTALAPVMVYLGAWIIATCTWVGDPAPLPYVPILNPQDIVQLLSLMLILTWMLAMKAGRLPASLDVRHVMPLVALVAFAWLNSLVAHAVHFYGEVPWRFGSMADSPLFQTSISIVWTLTAFAVMGLATRTARRHVWFVGAGLLGLVVVKLFLVDLADSGTVTRIVSFLSVGVLMLVIGYLSPAPPRLRSETSTT